MDGKKCKKCLVEKPDSEFYRNGSKMFAVCKACCDERRRATVEKARRGLRECRRCRTDKEASEYKKGSYVCHQCHAQSEGKICSVSGCDKPARSPVSDLCPMHYHRKWRHGDVGVNLRDRFYDFNERAMDAWNQQMAWLLGLIWSDGCMMGNSVMVTSTDYELVAQAEAVLGGRGIIKQRPGKDVWDVYVCSHHLRSVLEGYGLTERKSLTIGWPDSIPDGLRYDFIRGVFDGDGSACLHVWKKRLDRDPGLRVDWTSGSELFSMRLQEELLKDGITCSLVVRNNSWGTQTFRVAVQKQSSILAVYRLMYYQDGLPCLARKRDIIQKWLMTPRRRAGRPGGCDDKRLPGVTR